MSPEHPTVDLDDVDLFARGEHLDVLARLRDEDPVHRQVAPDGSYHWAITRYDDVLWAYHHHELLGSSHGAIVGGSFGREQDVAGNRMLVASDLPRHRMLKRQIQPWMTSRVARDVAQLTTQLVSSAWDRLASDGGGDLAEDVAPALPIAALMTVMGISYDAAASLVTMTRRMIGFRDERWVDTGDDEGLRLAWLQLEILEFFADLVADRRARPGDDLVSHLLAARVNGRPLSEDEVLFNCLNVAVGGNETTSHTACSGAAALLEHPESYESLRAAGTVTDAAVDELLRVSSTNAYVQRVARRDLELHGSLIREGDSVTLWNVSANHDERRFEEPRRLDLTRSPNPHLSYGSGLHRCVGSPLARAELTSFFQVVAASPVALRSAGDPPRLRSNFILGVPSMPVEVVA